MATIFNDPGVYVIEEELPRASTIDVPTLPAVFIGPLFQIVDQDQVTDTGVVLSEETFEISLDDEITFSYPSLVDAENPVDTSSVKVELVKSDGRRKEVPEVDGGANTVLNITDSQVTINLGDGATEEVYTFFKDLNDEWLSREIDYGVDDPNWAGISGATVHISYKSARNDLVGRVLVGQGAENTQILLGKGNKENPLGLAGRVASSVAPNTAHYYVPTRDYMFGTDTETIDEETEVIAALERIAPKDVHGIVVLSNDETTQQLAINHADEMSQPDEKMYRIAWTYKPLPSEDEVRSYLNLAIDDTLTEVEKREAQKDMLVQYGVSISNERGIVIYNDFTTNIDGETVELPGYYLAVAYAAYKASLPASQGLTNLPLSGVVEELKYQKGYFKPSQLRQISQGGIFAVVQDTEGAPVRCRAQWTTNMLNNSTKQVSIQYCKDSYSKGLINTLTPLIGVNNVTDTTLEVINETVVAYNNARKQDKSIVGSEIILIEQNDSDASRVDVEEEIAFPSPLDQIVVRLVY